MRSLTSKHAIRWGWEWLEISLVRGEVGISTLPVDLSAVYFVRRVANLVVKVQEESSLFGMSAEQRAAREARIWSSYRKEAGELKRLFCSTSENAFFPYITPCPVPYFAVPWYFLLLYNTAAALRRHCRRYGRATFGWTPGWELTERHMEQFAIGVSIGNVERAKQEWGQLCNLIGTTMLYGLTGYAFHKMEDDTRDLVLKDRSEYDILIAARSTWADFWILSLPATILDFAHLAGSALSVTSPETLLGSLAGWLTKNMAGPLNREFYRAAKRETAHPLGSNFEDAMTEIAIQLDALQEEALNGYVLRNYAAAGLKQLHGSRVKETAFTDLPGKELFTGATDAKLGEIERAVALDQLAGCLLSTRELDVYQINHLPNQEIATCLGLAIGSVASLKYRIRKKLSVHAESLL